MKTYFVYIMTNRPNGTLYIGVTNDLVRRVSEHREGLVEGFTKKYGLKWLVYYESFEDISAAIAREKALKTWLRAWKVRLLRAKNPDWDDLWGEITGMAG
ncbi:MAG: GIY-YIG nuclease family protein [Alphaproteobacteria bacterium]